VRGGADSVDTMKWAALVEQSRATARTVTSGSPGTWFYLSELLITTALVHSTSSSLSSQLLRQVSTNLTQMGRGAGRVLFLSAFLFGSTHVLAPVLTVAVVSIPLERWVGTARWLVVMVLGHVGASLVTTVGIWADVRSNRGGASLVQAIDVGPSYALMAAAGFLIFAAPRWSFRAALAVALGVYLARPFFGGYTFTDAGHAAAACIGAGLWSVLGPGVTARTNRRRATRGSAPRSSSRSVTGPVPMPT
jgi:hypothetical protein